MTNKTVYTFIKTVIFFCLCAFVMCLAGCSQEPSLQNKSENFVMRVFTAPSDQFAEINAQNQTPDNTAEYDSNVLMAIEDICDGFAAVEAMENSGGALYQNILLFHSMAASKGHTYRVDRVTAAEHSEKNFTYTAELTDDNSEDKLTLTGSIQFDENNLINYFDIRSSV